MCNAKNNRLLDIKEVQRLWKEMVSMMIQGIAQNKTSKVNDENKGQCIKVPEGH